MYDHGAQLCFPPPQCAWATYRHLLLGLPWSTGVHAGGEGHRGGGSRVVRSPNPVGVLASAWPGGAGIGGEGLQWWFFPLGITQQRCSASLVVQASSTSIPFAELLPPACPLRMSPHSQSQSSAWVCSPNPTFQDPALVCSGGLPAQAWGAGLWLVPSVAASLCPACL